MGQKEKSDNASEIIFRGCGHVERSPILFLTDIGNFIAPISVHLAAKINPPTVISLLFYYECNHGKVLYEEWLGGGGRRKPRVGGTSCYLQWWWVKQRHLPSAFSIQSQSSVK
jgi:hypothetical protein